MAAMWSITPDVHEWLDAAGDWLRARPAEHTVLLSVAETLRAGGSFDDTGAVPVALGWWADADGAVLGAFLHTPPHPVQLSALPAGAAGLLAAWFADQRRPVRQLGGDQRAAEAFAQAWLPGHPGATATVSMRERLYRLEELSPPDGTPGAARVAGPGERGLLLAWREAFLVDVFGHSLGTDDARVDDLLAYGGMTLWTVNDEPVSMASLTRPVAGMTRVGSVYTPPPLRRRGYAAAVVAAVSRAALQAGAHEVVLFTDLANPTSNSVYQSIGYRPVEDRVVIDLHAPASAAAAPASAAG
jgi:GNAT superfamily N-acetyltransferase